MRTALIALVAIAAAACVILLTPDVFASAASDGAIATIGQLEAEGYTVNVDRVGSAPLSECQVTSVRNPQQQTRLVNAGQDRRGRDQFVEVVVNRSITVSLDCSSR
jgi:hypothetical protein